jgi:hypothetical protein
LLWLMRSRLDGTRPQPARRDVLAVGVAAGGEVAHQGLQLGVGDVQLDQGNARR